MQEIEEPKTKYDSRERKYVSEVEVWRLSQRYQVNVTQWLRKQSRAAFLPSPSAGRETLRKAGPRDCLHSKKYPSSCLLFPSQSREILFSQIMATLLEHRADEDNEELNNEKDEVLTGMRVEAGSARGRARRGRRATANASGNLPQWLPPLHQLRGLVIKLSLRCCGS